MIGTYEEQAAHHVHAGAEAGEEDALVSRDNPFAAGLFQHSVSDLFSA